jgi:hypothetical protein
MNSMLEYATLAIFHPGWPAVLMITSAPGTSARVRLAPAGLLSSQIWTSTFGRGVGS